MTLLVFVFATVLIAPSCSSDETFEEVVEKSDLDQSYTTDDREIKYPSLVQSKIRFRHCNFFAGKGGYSATFFIFSVSRLT